MFWVVIPLQESESAEIVLELVEFEVPEEWDDEAITLFGENEGFVLDSI